MSTKSDSPISLDTFWPYQTVYLADQISRYTRAVVSDHADLNLSQWRVLAAVADGPRRTAAEVTAITPMDKTIVSRAVNSLIRVGLIEKTPNKHDKRRAALVLSQDGREIYQQIAKILSDTLVENFKTTTPPQDFIHVLHEYINAMQKLNTDTGQGKKT